MSRLKLFFTGILIVLVAAVVVLPPLFATESKSAKPVTHTVRATFSRNQIHILFIGNSYTYFNNLPHIVSALAESAHEPKLLDAQMITMGGATLKQHWQDGQALDAIRQGGWDYVVLQEHSTLGPTTAVDGVLPINNPTDFYKYARLFDNAIKKSGAKTIFFMTWARQNAPTNQRILSADYTSIAGELGDDIAPVGLAWQSALKTGVTLHQSDMSHPNSAGSYLAACVFFSKIYNQSPIGLTARISGSETDTNPLSVDGKQLGNKTSLLVDLNEKTALGLQRAAWYAVLAQTTPSF